MKADVTARFWYAAVGVGRQPLSLKTLLVNKRVLGYVTAMTQAAASRHLLPMRIPAFEAEGGLLALLPKAALERDRHIDIVIVGARPGSNALIAELKSYSSSSAVISQHAGDRARSFNIDLVVRAHPDQDHEPSATALSALLSRLHRALQRVVGAASDESVHRALGRPSDMGVVIDLLRSTLPLLSAEQELDPELGDQVASLAAEDDLIRSAGGLKDAKWVADYLAISPKSVAAKARRSELLALARGDRNLYPAFQFQDGQVIPAVRELLRVLPLTNGWSRLSFLVTPDPGLDDRTPIDAFGTDRAAVLALATDSDNQGTS